MNRAILEACLPAFIALLVLALLMWLTVRISGARWNWRRLRELNRCQDGGVQTLAFVLTLPMFIIFLQTIIQISQLMLGIMGVHYSAYAAARAAVVWIPADMGGDQPPNAFLEPGSSASIYGEYWQEDDIITISVMPDSVKYRRIRLAALLGVAPFCPSADLRIIDQNWLSSDVERASESTKVVYHSMVPQSTNPRIDTRIENKLHYAEQNTAVIVEWRDSTRNSMQSPTYNPHLTAGHPTQSNDWNPFEVGWQDPVTVYVVHRFSLLPGPGRWLAKQLVWTNDLPQRVVNFIDPLLFDQTRTDPAVIVIPATATFVNEGLKSTFPYDHSGTGSVLPPGTQGPSIP